MQLQQRGPRAADIEERLGVRATDLRGERVIRAVEALAHADRLRVKVMRVDDLAPEAQHLRGVRQDQRLLGVAVRIHLIRLSQRGEHVLLGRAAVPEDGGQQRPLRASGDVVDAQARSRRRIVAHLLPHHHRAHHEVFGVVQPALAGTDPAQQRQAAREPSRAAAIDDGSASRSTRSCIARAMSAC